MQSQADNFQKICQQKSNEEIICVRKSALVPLVTEKLFLYKGSLALFLKSNRNQGYKDTTQKQNTFLDLLRSSAGMAQNDRNTRISQKAFEMLDKMYGKSHKTSPKPHVPRDDYFPSCFNQSSNEYGGPKIYTVKEATSTITARRVTYQYSSESMIKPVGYHPTDHIHYFSGARPFLDHGDRFERSKEGAISCDEAFLRYGGVLIKEFRN